MSGLCITHECAEKCIQDFGLTDGDITLKWTLNKLGIRVWTGSMWLKVGWTDGRLFWTTDGHRTSIIPKH
jgi:hypothetical protein